MSLNLGTLTAQIRLDGARQFKSELGGLVKDVKKLGAAYLTLQTAQKAFNLAKTAAQTRDAAQAFRAAGFSIGEFRKATNGLISDADLVKKFNLARSLGVTKDAFLTLAKVAQASARTTGQDVKFLFESAIVGAARQSPQILDNLGITIKRTGDKAKFMADLIDKGNKIIAEAGDIADSASAPFDQLTASIANLAEEFGESLRPAISTATSALSDFLGETAELMKLNRVSELAEKDFKQLAALFQIRKSLQSQIGPASAAQFGDLIDPETGKSASAGLRVEGLESRIAQINAQIEKILPSYQKILEEIGTFTGGVKSPKTGGKGGKGAAEEFAEKAATRFGKDASTALVRGLLRKARLERARERAGLPALKRQQALQMGMTGQGGPAQGFQMGATGAGPATVARSRHATAMISGMRGAISMLVTGLPGAVSSITKAIFDIGKQIVASVIQLGQTLANDLFGGSSGFRGAQTGIKRGVSAVGVGGAALGGAAALGAIATAAAVGMAPLIPLLPMFVVGASMVVTALVALAVALSPIIAAFSLLAGTAFFGALGMAQVSQTKNSAKLNEAFDNAMANAVKPLESFAFQLMALAPVLELVMTALNEVAGETLTDLPQMMFNAFKMVGTGAIALAWAYQQAMITMNNVLSVIGAGFAAPGELEGTLDDITALGDALAELDFNTSLAQAVAGLEDVGDAAGSTADSFDRVTRNLPEGFKVANAAFQAADPSGAANPFAGVTPFGGNAGINVNGNLVINGASGDMGELAQQVLDTAGKDRFANYGNSTLMSRFNWSGAN